MFICQHGIAFEGVVPRRAASFERVGDTIVDIGYDVSPLWRVEVCGQLRSDPRAVKPASLLHLRFQTKPSILLADSNATHTVNPRQKVWKISGSFIRGGALCRRLSYH